MAAGVARLIFFPSFVKIHGGIKKIKLTLKVYYTSDFIVIFYITIFKI